MRPGAGTWLTAAAAAIVMVWAPLLLLSPPPVAGQGLSISPEQLGAGEAAVVDQFSRFEEILDLSSQSTGGRGRGGRGGTTSTTGGTGFRSANSLQRLQLATYYLAGSPPAYSSWNTSQNPGGISLLPGVRDQGDCDSCVAQAIAAAIQAAAAAAWRQNADQAQFDVNAASLYYCSEGGKTCKTGWDLQEALTLIMDKGQHLIRPTACARNSATRMLDNPTSEPQVNDWKPACQEAAQACSNVSSRAQPWLSCSYKSLSSFVDIQRHIRQHGGVLTRITIYNDFWKHFNVTSDGGTPSAAVNGATHPAYNRTVDSRSRPLFGHAAVIVGYNNTELTWTLLNSYGTQRFTLDGLFKIAMGVAGVAVPDQTFGIECKPTPGGPDDLHFTDWLTPWIADPALRPRKPVDYWDRAKDWNNLNASCYRYNTSAGDTVSGIADAFGVSLQQLVRDNQALFPLQQVNYTLKTGTQLNNLQMVANISNQLRLDDGIEPFFVCRTRKEGQIWPGKVICKQSDLAPCASSFGPCKISYSEADVSVPLALGTALKVCNISRVDQPGAFDRVAYLKDPRDSQPRALKVLLQALPDAKQDIFVDDPNVGYNTIGDNIDFFDFDTSDFGVNCNKAGFVTYLGINNGYTTLPFAFRDARAVYALLNLDGLTQLRVGITGGTLPPQLGALKLQKLRISIGCPVASESNSWGRLPDNWLLGEWRKSLQSLEIGASAEDNGFTAADGRCGLTGSLPARWYEPAGTPTALTTLDLSFNQLTSSLPEALPKVMPNLEWLFLQHNFFQGAIPTSFSTLGKLTFMYLHNNKLSGQVPLGLKPEFLMLDDNPGLQGCVLYVPSRDDGDVSFANTGITGLCEADAEAVWSRQLQAVDLLPRFMGLSVDEGRQLVAGLKLPQTVAAFFKEHPDAKITSKYLHSYELVHDPDDYFDGTYGVVNIQLRVINGMPCIVELEQFAPLAGPVDMRALPGLLRRLPYLEILSFENDNILKLYPSFEKPHRPSARHQLPADLPSAAPPSLRLLTLSHCGFSGTIPDWQNWTSLQLLKLRGNFISGTLPQFKGMTNLATLDLAINFEISGTLPAAWAENLPASTGVSRYTSIDLSATNIGGSIPPSWWQHFSDPATINLEYTSVAGCRPPGWRNYNGRSWHWSEALARSPFYWSDALVNAPFCGQDEAAFLRQLKRLLQTAIPSLLSTWQTGNGTIRGGRPGATLPAHCRAWRGITCSADGQVIGVDLSSLRGAISRPLDMTALLLPLAGLANLQTLKLHGNPRLFAGSTIPSAFNWSAWSKLQHLDVSNCNLTGSLPASLCVLPSLAHLNTSHNPGMSGTLPERLGAATSLAVLDVFECGLSGSLPVRLAALPLQVLRVGSEARPASADVSISGPLPPEYGLISTLRELKIINTWVTGGIPSAWFDPAEAATAAAAAAAANTATAAAAAATASSSEQTAEDGVDPSAARMAAAWQHVQDRLTSSSSSSEEAAAAAAAPAGDGLSMQQLEVLVLSGNTELEGRLPPQLSASQQLKVLRLSGSKLTGPLPSSYSRLKQLQELDLSGNALSGGIPALWLGLRSLSLMDLSGNPAIGGALPADFNDLAGPGRSLRCLRLFGTGTDGQWNQTPGGLAAVKAAFEGASGSQVKVAISSDAPEC